MNKLVLALCLVSTLGVKLEAQTSNPGLTDAQRHERKNLSPEDRAKKDAERAEKNLTLTSDQKSKWEAAALERAKADQQLHQKMQGSTTPEQRKEFQSQKQANKSSFQTKVVALLTPEQKAKYDQMQSEHKGHDHGHKMKGN